MRILTTTYNPAAYNHREFPGDIFEEMDRLFDWQRPSERSMFTPAFEMEEKEDHYLLSFDLPGMKKEDIKIEINAETLTISGERKREIGSSESSKVTRFERFYGNFSRSFTLPNSIDVNNVEARYENGVLELALPKTPAAKVRTVEIQSGKTSSGFLGKFLGSQKVDEKSSNH